MSAGEAVLAAWLLEQWFDRPFTFGDLRRVLGFVAAAGIAAAASAVGGAATMTLFHTTAPFWEVWRTWFLSDGLGILVVAPLFIGLGQMWQERPSRREWIEGVGVLALQASASLVVMVHPAGSWISFSPGALVVPLLLWLAARCPPTFAIVGVFLASITVILATTFGHRPLWGCGRTFYGTCKRCTGGRNHGNAIHAGSGCVVRPAQGGGGGPSRERTA